MGEVELLPCPFCGAEPEIGGPQKSISGTYYWIACSCSGLGPQSTSIAGATRLWNARADTLNLIEKESGE